MTYSTFTKPRSPLRRQSKKQRAKAKARRATVTEVLELSGGMCEVEGCPNEAVDAHEILPRSAGGSITDVDNVVALCRFHHDKCHSQPLWAYSVGLKVSRYANTEDAK